MIYRGSNNDSVYNCGLIFFCNLTVKVRSLKKSIVLGRTSYKLASHPNQLAVILDM